MKKNFNIKSSLIQRACFLLVLLLGITTGKVLAQDATTTATPKEKPVKNTFGSSWCMDNQTVMVPIKGTMEMDIQHRFGTFKNGVKDLYGIFAPSNIRIGLSYSPIKNLFVGAGITKDRMQTDLNAKYAILQQTPKSMPVSVTYYVNMSIDGREKVNFRYPVHRLSYFHQLMIGHKITEKFSAQVSANYSWFNNVEGYADSKGEIQNKMYNGHASFSAIGRYKYSSKSAITIGYDQPLTSHPTNNPRPNISFGMETCTSSHAFQVFAGNYYGIIPQSNSMFNQNDYHKLGQFLIGFNITRLFNF